MAIVKCPECNAGISSVAEKCVHCGCSITVCSDCGALNVGEKDSCTACGFNFNRAAEIKNGSGFRSLLDYWRASSPFDKWATRLIPIILAVMGVGFIAFLIMAVTNTLRLGYNTDNTKIFQIGVSVTVAVIFSVIFFISLIATSVIHTAFIPFRCGAWIRDNDIDVKRFTEQLSALPRSKRTFKNNREIRSAYVAEYPREFSKTVIVSAVCGIFYIVCFIIACVFLNEGIEAYIVEKAFTANPVTLVGKIDWLLLLIPIGIILVSLITDIIFRVIFRRNVLNWIGYPMIPKKKKAKAPVKAEDATEKSEIKEAVEEETPTEEAALDVNGNSDADTKTTVGKAIDEVFNADFKEEAKEEAETDIKSEEAADDDSFINAENTEDESSDEAPINPDVNESETQTVDDDQAEDNTKE